MESKVAVVHRSEIVRKGLTAVLNPIWKSDIAQCQSMADFMSRGYCQVCRSLVFLESGLFSETALTETIAASLGKDSYPGDYEKTINDLIEKTLAVKYLPGNISVILVFDKPSGGESLAGGEFVSLYSDYGVFHRIINDFKQKGATLSENENELTVREKEILRQVAMGYSNKEIADSLFISIHTVITHRKNITGKLGIKSISGLTVYAIINHLIDPDQIDPEKLI
jgi:DNA-binding CsgD family transcriptional regulator